MSKKSIIHNNTNNIRLNIINKKNLLENKKKVK